ncbi:MAG TPA: NAD(+) synthase [Sulfurovum sp.]|jgi:NAD+ synthase (glutamine-hydrolysing)|nr:MAG: NAD(+) synthase [Sulfurovum sp. 35-42-20]OYZ26573.1 MAG: NAD(+) synthase [Sulfurovum sp. 16-42-52]OYZ50660.1 MAG: NAD(+) synthase [Sulfurovum sp. 24-42-9]OZA47144.1 MAG: NAD(+) synthase [Sulfurovum sp. 17-42-90]OZA59047.1 MAG: NAD(+) synthase [Sulfurovum sp. 39-42-12]HQR73451.1 NAD(+) synthase [Sulfurovum sp.]
MFGHYRVAAAVNTTVVGNPAKNAEEILKLICQAEQKEVCAIVFPELTLTGYTASDLLLNQTLLAAQNESLGYILKNIQQKSIVVIIGVAVLDADRLYNCAAVLQQGKILGLIPKTYLPNKKEFYEKRHFASGRDITNHHIDFLESQVPFGVDLLFTDRADMTFGVEICEDLWAVTPPSLQMASNGANLLFNLSASNELIGKHLYREELVRTQSARCMAAYVYASAGVGESSTDTVFGGHCIISEYGSTLAQNERFSLDSNLITADVDLERLSWLRLNESSFGDAKRTVARRITLSQLPKLSKIERCFSPMPFVPSRTKDKEQRCDEIIQIQAHGLIKRMRHTQIQKAVIGISGGLDSTLALLSTHKAFMLMGWDTQNILALTMPGFGTTSRTKSNAVKLCEALKVKLLDVDITELSLKEFEAIGHDKEDHSVTYENVQARARTSLLMNMANKEGGLVIGTGDLSEIALGWSTYNGDHMSMYALNSGIPKTLIQYVIGYFKSDVSIASILDDILATPISPELLPHKEDEIVQETESIVGPYELHDFFLYHFIKYGAKPSKIIHLATIAFDTKYDKETITRWLSVFLRRFFTQQFKRSCMPDGPKVGTISLSPRADWKMASDVDFSTWLEELN